MPPLVSERRVKLWPDEVLRSRLVSTVMRPDASSTMFALWAMLSSTCSEMVLTLSPLPRLGSLTPIVPSAAAPSWLPPVELTMRRLSGSRRKRPAAPLGADRSTLPVRLMSLWLDTSAKPPSPPSEPPRAEILPACLVLFCDSTVTLPPLPDFTASADRVAPASTVTLSDQVPERPVLLPMATSPPPLLPEASMRAFFFTAISAPVATTVPPVCPSPRPPASTVPPMLTVPVSPPDRTILPLALPTEVALMTPSVLMTLSITPFTARADRVTLPPSAAISPELTTSAATGFPSASFATVFTAELASKLMRPSPWKSSVKVSAPPSATLPSFARMTPELRTCGATSAASPLSLTVMSPSFTTMALGLVEAWSNWYLPAMKLASEMLAVVATSPPTSTLAPAPITTPLGLTSMTVPLADKLPMILDGSFPVTRFSVTLEAEGCWKVTFSPASMLKDFQVMMALSVDWRISIDFGVADRMVAAPAVTVPSRGLA